MMSRGKSATLKLCLAQMICNPPQPACYNQCAVLKERLKTLMDDNMVDDIVYKQCVSVDRSRLELNLQ